MRLTSRIYLLLKLFNVKAIYDWSNLSITDHPEIDNPDIDESIMLLCYYFIDAVLFNEFTWIA